MAGGGTACGQSMKSGANRGTTPGQRGMSGARNLYERLIRNHLLFIPEVGISRQVGMSKFLSHDGDRILV